LAIALPPVQKTKKLNHPKETREANLLIPILSIVEASTLLIFHIREKQFLAFFFCAMAATLDISRKLFKPEE